MRTVRAVRLGVVASAAILVGATVMAAPSRAAEGVAYEYDTFGPSGASEPLDWTLDLDSTNAAFTPFVARSSGTLGKVEVQLAHTSTDAELEVSITNGMTASAGLYFPGSLIASKTVAVGGLGSVVVDLSSVDRQLFAGNFYTIALDATRGSVEVPLREGLHFEWESQFGPYVFQSGDIDASVMVTGIDGDDPSVSIEAGPEGAVGRRGWFTEYPWIDYTCSDPTSGVVDCPDDGQLESDGRHSLEVAVTDVVGNTSAAAALTVKVDTTDPVVTLTPDRLPNRNGWYRDPVVVTTTATDATSGVAAVSEPQTYGRTIHASGGASDVAGNLRTRALLVRVDQRDPDVRILGIDDGETFSSMPNLRSRASDGTCASCSGVSSTYAEAVRLGRHKYAAVATASDYAGNDSRDRVVFYIR